jgi:hypothetical protein
LKWIGCSTVPLGLDQWEHFVVSTQNAALQ